MLTCEHAGNRVPARYRGLFATGGAILRSHRGYDIGALAVAKRLSNTLAAPLLDHRISRLLIDVNRSLGHPTCFSEFTRNLPPDEHRIIIEKYYVPHRANVFRALEESLRGHGFVVHVGVHSFTPELNGEVRRADVALLYDPKRRREQRLSIDWLDGMRELDPSLRLRRNYPYRGQSDGLVTTCRRTFGPRYIGIELEVHQGRLASPTFTRRVSAMLGDSLEAALGRAG